ncbi:hypothetical protein CCR75_000962 [Bremia lactucae]|uniref:DUF1279 domain-containing protein n=1 Tax=Bremia lactucae TaxID=4779 RepID=A0A976FLM5_BRELC|nr:hypothetical protein CCR75_000962 [Bremia lactucae]
MLPIRTLFRQSGGSPLLAQCLTRRSSSKFPLKASSRFQNVFLKSLQAPSFASVPSRDDNTRQQLHGNTSKSKNQQIQELIETNMALKKEVETLKAEVAKKPNKFIGTLQQYGLPFLAWWTSLYVASGVTIYVALDTGLVSGASIIDFIMQIGLDKLIDPARLDPKYGNIAIAVIVNECLEIIRFPITLATLPFIKRVFSRKKTTEAT